MTLLIVNELRVASQFTKLFSSILDSTVWQESKETKLVWVTMLAMCDRQRSYDGDEPLDGAYWHRRMNEIASRGQRILAIASRPATDRHRELTFADVEGGLIFVGAQMGVRIQSIDGS